jgi:hypothetical protein
MYYSHIANLPLFPLFTLDMERPFCSSLIQNNSRPYSSHLYKLNTAVEMVKVLNNAANILFSLFYHKKTKNSKTSKGRKIYH